MDILIRAENGMAHFVLGGDCSNELADESVSGFGVAEWLLVEVGQEPGNGTVVDRRGHPVEADGHGAGRIVGFKVGA